MAVTFMSEDLAPKARKQIIGKFDLNACSSTYLVRLRQPSEMTQHHTKGYITQDGLVLSYHQIFFTRIFVILRKKK